MNDTASNYNIMELDGHQLVGYEGRLYVPVALRQHTIEWYHHTALYCGVIRKEGDKNKVDF